MNHRSCRSTQPCTPRPTDPRRTACRRRCPASPANSRTCRWLGGRSLRWRTGICTWTTRIKLTCIRGLNVFVFWLKHKQEGKEIVSIVTSTLSNIHPLKTLSYHPCCLYTFLKFVVCLLPLPPSILFSELYTLDVCKPTMAHLNYNLVVRQQEIFQIWKMVGRRRAWNGKLDFWFYSHGNIRF